MTHCALARPHRRTVRRLSLLLLLVGAWTVRLPAQEARFTVNPDNPQPSPGMEIMGMVGWRATPRLQSMVTELGAGQNLFRRTLRMSDPSEGRHIGEDFQLAEATGMKSWMTVVGTPRSLSPFPDADGNQYGTGLPEYARYPPTDPVAWADGVLAFIDDMEATEGVVPDYVEIWNEPERVEWFKGTGSDLLELYAVAASRIRSIRPGIRVGGPGLAGWRSEMGLGESVLLALVRQAKAASAPLDFVSWHHYATSTELLYSRMPQALENLGASLGLPPFEAIVSEWNIYPSAEGPAGVEFDGPHGAANLGGFLISARTAGLDRSMFFLDRDEDNDPGITDLTGTGLGLITQHGVKKPAARLLEIFRDMAGRPHAAVATNGDEWNVAVTTSLEGSTLRIVVTNDVVTGLWVFANRARQYGMEPGWLYEIWLAAGGTQADEHDLVKAGLTLQQARDTLSFIPEVLRYGRYATEPRPIVLEVLGSTPFTLGAVTRFTETVNAPAQFQQDLLPTFEAAEIDAAFESALATALHLTALGYPYTAAEILAIPGDFFVWAAAEGIPYGYAVTAYKVLQDTLRDSRLMHQASLNSLPQTLVSSETAASAGLILLGREIQFEMAPNTSLVVVIELAGSVASD